MVFGHPLQGAVADGIAQPFSIEFPLDFSPVEVAFYSGQLPRNVQVLSISEAMESRTV